MARVHDYAFPTSSFFGRLKIKRDLRDILKEQGFKREFFRHPFTETYYAGEIEAWIFSEKSVDGYKKVRLDLEGLTEDPLFDSTAEKLNVYLERK